MSDELKRDLAEAIMASGAVAVGFAVAEDISAEALRQYEGWIDRGDHAGMEYMERHALLKSHPRNVLTDAATVISIAYSYAPAEWRDSRLPVIAAYAYGDDYHDVLRARLQPIVERMKERYGGSWRICIDSAPLAERYWAVRSGVGFRGFNGSVIVPGHGSFVFLAEILTSHVITPDLPKDFFCSQCGACMKACPTGALRDDGTIDCRRCINYLTIEHRGEWKQEGAESMATAAGSNSLFGCDICQRVCPHNARIPSTKIIEFYPREGIISGGISEDDTREGIKSDEICNKRREGIKYADIYGNNPREGIAEGILAMTQEEFSKTFKGSPIKRTKLEGLKRNAANLR